MQAVAAGLSGQPENSAALLWCGVGQVKNELDKDPAANYR